MTDPLQAYFLVGPTAVGKSAVAQWIAERQPFDIVSADSMQVYRGMDIGTAKPTPAERRRVRYWMIDLVDPGAAFSVARFTRRAREALARIRDSGREAVVVGGTGLYVKCLVLGLAPVPGPDPRLRQEWERRCREQGPEPLRRELRRLCPEMYASCGDPDNPRRLIRCLELARADLQAKPVTWHARGRYPPVTGLRMDRARIRERIRRRARYMFETGLLREVEDLLAQGFDLATTARQAIGYAEAVDCIRGQYPVETAVERTVARTCRLARRQMTWFRHMLEVDWIDVDAAESAETVAGRVLESWKRNGPTPIAAGKGSPPPEACPRDGTG